MRDGYGAPPPRDHNLPPGALLDVDALTHQLEQLGLDWADKRAAAEALDDATKSVLGAALLECDGKNAPERDARARNAPIFTAHRDAVRDAKREAYQAHIRYEVMKTRIELRRSNSATERTLAGLR
jgi:hypothetical protein